MVGHNITFSELFKHVYSENSFLSFSFFFVSGSLIMVTVASNKTYVLHQESRAESHGFSLLTLEEDVIRPQSSEMSGELLQSIQHSSFSTSNLQQNHSCDKSH